MPHFAASRGLVLAGCSSLLLATALNLAGPLIVAQAIDVDLAAGDDRRVAGKAFLFLGILVGTLVLRYGGRITVEVAAQRAMLDLKRTLFGHLVHHDLALHDEHPSGRLITRVQGDTEALRILFTEVILAVPADILLFAGMFAILAVRAPSVLPLVFVVLPPYLLLFWLFRRVSPKRFLAVRAVRAQLTGFLTEYVRAMPTLRQFDRLAWANERSEALNREVFGKDWRASLQPVWYFNSVASVRTLGIVLLLFVGASRVAEGTMTLGLLMMGLGYLRQMFHPLLRLSHNLATVERARAASVRIGELLDTPRAVDEPAEPKPWPATAQSLRLEGVHFAYRPDAPVLRGIDLEVPAGSHVGIVGATGGGKTTLLNLLLRFRDPTAGRLTVNGVDLREISLETLRHHIGLVLQDVHLFPGTVLENLGGDRDAARAAMAQLDLDLPLDHVLREGGANLSRGERQLITFARALVSDPEVLVLDEATSAVDPATEARVQAALERLQAGRTTITVAHRLSTVRDCDRICVLSGGLLVESGTHEQLMAAGGVYAGMARLQDGRAA